MLNYDAVLVSLTGDVAMTYATIRTLEQRLAYVRKNVALQEQGLEIAEARWFSFDETRQMLKNNHPQGTTLPPPMSIAYQMLR